MHKSSFKYCWDNTILEMLPSRALFLPEQKELFICDVHLGKAEYFQQNGIPLTNDFDEDNFLRITKLVKKYSPKRLVILGDLFHSRFSISNSLREQIESLPKKLNTQIALIIGNHDKGCKIKNIKISNILKIRNIIFSHEPTNSNDNNILNICGHYHPKLYLKNDGDKLSFRCFAMDMKNNILYLPAFGDLTGGYPCKKSFKKYKRQI